mgnify:CR=1 FL=1
MSNTIKVALAGAGAFGIKHLDAIRLIDGVEVVSLVSRELEKTREVAAKYGIGHVATDLADSLALKDGVPLAGLELQSVGDLAEACRLLQSSDLEVVLACPPAAAPASILRLRECTPLPIVALVSSEAQGQEALAAGAQDCLVEAGASGWAPGPSAARCVSTGPSCWRRSAGVGWP